MSQSICSLTGWYGVDVDGRGLPGSSAALGPTTLTPWRKVSEPSQVIPMSAARRFPSLSMRSCWIMGWGVTASCWGRCTAGRSRLFSTSPVRSPITRYRALLSLSSWLQTDLILSLSRVIRPSSLCNFWTSTSSYCKSADAFGEPGGDCGTGVGGSVGGPLDRKTISVSSPSPSDTGSLCLLSRAASWCVFLQLLFVDDFKAAQRERE